MVTGLALVDRNVALFNRTPSGKGNVIHADSSRPVSAVLEELEREENKIVPNLSVTTGIKCY